MEYSNYHAATGNLICLGGFCLRRAVYDGKLPTPHLYSKERFASLRRGAVCGSPAGTDLSGGRQVTAVPTATPSATTWPVPCSAPLRANASTPTLSASSDETVVRVAWLSTTNTELAVGSSCASIRSGGPTIDIPIADKKDQKLFYGS